MVDLVETGRAAAHIQSSIKKSELQEAGQLADKFEAIVKKKAAPEPGDTQKAESFIRTVGDITAPQNLLALAQILADEGRNMPGDKFDRYVDKIAQNIDVAETASNRLRHTLNALKN
jgi:hypothetical protein